MSLNMGNLTLEVNILIGYKGKGKGNGTWRIE
jgi:hypothetical protein